jgi:hypothetical protein
VGEPTSEEKHAFQQRRSPRFNSADAKLDAKQEVEWYLSQQKLEYLKEIDEMNRKIGEPMSNECRVAICIAAASHQEGANIYKTLFQYTGQVGADGNPLSPQQFEINLFLNRPSNSIPDNTASEVARFQKDHPEIKVRVFEKVFDGERPRMGVISKYVADMALRRSAQRTTPTNSDLILATNDADADLISKAYVSSIISEYDNPDNQHIDGALGKIEWDPEAYIKYPGFHVANRFYQFVETQQRHSKNNVQVGSSGANFTIKASSYSAIGGYNTDIDEAQDV